MTRPLARVDGDDPVLVLDTLRAALTGEGPAVFPAGEGASDAPLPDDVPRAVSLVIETSGSTDAPKRVALSADSLLASAAASAAVLGGSGQWLLALPAHYIAGAQVLVRSIAAESDPVMMSGPFTAEAFADAAAVLDADLRFTSLVPAQLARVVEAAERDSGVLAAARRFDRILVGGQATPPPLLERAAGLGIAVTRTYGSSETAGGCVYDGIPLGGVRLAVVEGIVEISGPMLALGYLGDDARTADAFPEHDGRRWYRTGDLGEVDGSGRLRVLGRADNVIISGGVKVSLDAVERHVRELPGLGDAVVVGAPHAVWGEAPVVAVTAPADLDALREHVGATLGPASRPDRTIVLDALPTLPSGKPDRRSITAVVVGMQDESGHESP